MIADTPVLDYYRATDHGCKLQRIGEHALNADTYGIGMAKGFPLKVIISKQNRFFKNSVEFVNYPGLLCTLLVNVVVITSIIPIYPIVLSMNFTVTARQHQYF